MGQYLYLLHDMTCGIIPNNQIALIGTLIQRGGGTGPMMPPQPVGVKPNTVPNPAVGVTLCTQYGCVVIRILEDERAAVHNVQLPFLRKGNFYYRKGNNDNHFYVLSKIAVHL